MWLLVNKYLCIGNRWTLSNFSDNMSTIFVTIYSQEGGPIKEGNIKLDH